MATALFELEDLLIKQNDLTAEEVNVLNGYKTKAIRQFTFSALVGGGGIMAGPFLTHVVSNATWNLRTLPRLCLAGGVAVIYGFSGLSRSLNSSADDILSADGSRMQKELATIMLQKQKYRDNPLMKHLFSKHFYSEEVYYDTSSEPALRWRFRNFFSDNVAYGQSTENIHHPQEYGNDSYQDPPTDSQSGGNKIESTRTNFSSSTATVNSGNYLEDDPLGCFFGSATEPSEEIHKPATPSKASKVDKRGRGRARRRRRMQRHESSDDS